jgi:hypothetical protein
MSAFVRLVAAPLLGLCVAFLAQASFADDWVVLAPGDGKYVITMPGKAEESTQKIDTATGPADLHQYVVSVADDEAYISSYIEYADKIVAARSPQDHLKVAEQGTMNGLAGSTLRMEKETNVGDHPGRVFVLDLKDGLVYTACIYLVGNRLYQNVAVTTKDKAGSPGVIRFLESFTVYKE